MREKKTHHSLEANAVEILGAGVPNDVSGGAGTGGRPVLDLGDFAAPAVASVLILPLPVDAAHHPSAREDAADADLFALPARLQ